MSRRRRWLRLSIFALLVVLASLAVIYAILETGAGARWVRAQVIEQLEQRTGARVELGAFHLDFFPLRAHAENLTLHGLEDAHKPPLFHADRVDVGITVLSFFNRDFELRQLVFERPQIVVRFEKDGRSNLPTPQIASNRPWRDTLFDWRIHLLELRDGSAIINDQKIPLEVKGQDLQFKLSYDARTLGGEIYSGNLRWQQVEFAASADVKARSDLSAKFTLHRDAFELDELIWKFPHSELDVRAELPSFSKSDWNLRYRGRVSLADVRAVFHQPLVPDATVDFSGQAKYLAGEWTAGGHYAGKEIQLPYDWFHDKGIETWGDYDLAKQRLVVPTIGARALGGTLEGRGEMDLKTMAVRTETHIRGFSLAAAFDAVNNPDFPVDPLHWDAAMDVDSVNTWSGSFHHFRSTGNSRWSPRPALAPGIIPVTAQIGYDYSEDARAATFAPSEISTPKAKIDFDGYLGGADSALELKLNADDLTEWDDFINKLRGVGAVPAREAGDVIFRGRILGPIAGPTFAGHFNASHARYDNFYWDDIDGQLEYSLDAFRLTNATVKRGQSSATVDLTLQLDGDWSFVPTSHWTLEAHVQHAPTADVQGIFGMSYPLTGFLTGDFHGSGTSADPVLDANFSLADIETKGIHFDSLGGQLHLSRDEIRISHGELRRDTGRVSGDLVYRPDEQTAEFNLTGTGIPLEKFAELQRSSLPIAGQLNFELRGSGPIRAPVVRGDLRLVSLKIGADLEGNFGVHVASDGQLARLDIKSETSKGSLDGQINIGLTGDDSISGNLSVHQFDLDVFLSAGLHLKDLTRPSVVDGEFTISGALRQPDTIEVKADIASISFDYEFVQLQNDGPIRFTYHRNEVRIEQAHLHGPNTDLQLSGSARFDRDRPLRFNLSGGVNLRFAKGIVPDLEAQGASDVNVSVEGTMSKPRITGRVQVHDVSANYSDFPAGLSHVNGDLVFDRSRLVFDHLTAESGGGQLTLSGGVTYGEGSFRYEINVQTPQVRVRYPVGVSWLVGGTLQLSGTQDAAVLSGRIQVKRLLLGQGVDLASFFASSSDTSASPVSSSAFMRNLTFDIAGNTVPGAQIEWSGAHVEIDGDLHLRGTWDRPVLLGHIHLLGGEMGFRGNTFTLTRGDINFANPFRLDPVLNVEATSVISQYQVTINFSGPASRLALNYRSDPPLPDSDIIALLALGSTGQESALRSQSAGGQNYGATALLSEAISTGLGGRIERLFGISHFRVDPFLAGTATESNAAARVTIEQQFTRDLTITYSSNAASDQEQLIQVEYHVRRDLSIIFLRDINGTYGFDIKFVKHFN